MGLLDSLGLKPRGAAPGGPASAGGAAAAGAAAGAAAAPPRSDAVATKLAAALATSYDTHLAKAEKAVAAQVVPALKKMLEGELEALRRQRAEADALEPQARADRMSLVSSRAHTLSLRAETMREDGAEGARQIEQWADKPLAALTKLVKAQPQPARGIYEPRLPVLEKRLADARARLDKADFEGLIRIAGPLKYACDDTTAAVRDFARDHPAYQAYRAKVVKMLARMKGAGLLDADGRAALAGLEAALGRADALGPIRGFGPAKRSLEAVVPRAKALRESNAAYKGYEPERDRLADTLKALRAHKQAERIKDELRDLDERLKEADKLARKSEGGSLKALTALKAIREQATRLRALADKLAKAEAKLPALRQKLEAGGQKKRSVEQTAGYALKLLVEEECSEDEAVKMALDADDYVDAGLDERDALVSSRVKSSLEKSGVAPDFAKSIGKNLRTGGTATADDAKALGQEMAKLSKKVVDELGKAKIEMECCRGPVTEALPELAGVLPRGWPETTTWDDVPGVFSPGNKKVVVGTMDDGGTRKVPGAGQGPIPHGSPFMVGHEAGHAFDSAEGKQKRENKDFLAARQADVAAGRPGGMYGPRDNYFLTAAEGGANNAGATSETFAESFAMHFSGQTLWPKLMAFWAKNPWGV